jgi:methylated-DNA-[protein]-cysteine S-methyltransferase
VFFTYCDSPIGELLLAGDAQALRVISFPNDRNRLAPADDWRQSDAALHDAVAQLRAYFAGELHEFKLPVDPVGTEFQRQVWDALQTIPYGTTVSYGELARRLRKPTATRAVGAANGANPIPIIIPCHRVIGANGSLTGFGGGLDAKRWLLEHEHALPESARQHELWT